MNRNFGEIYLIPVVRPRPEFHKAGLLIERKVPDVDLAGRFEDRRGCPDDSSGVMQHGFGHCRYNVLAIGARIIGLDIGWMRFVVRELTCCKGRCPAARCAQTGRTAP